MYLIIFHQSDWCKYGDIKTLNHDDHHCPAHLDDGGALAELVLPVMVLLLISQSLWHIPFNINYYQSIIVIFIDHHYWFLIVNNLSFHLSISLAHTCHHLLFIMINQSKLRKPFKICFHSADPTKIWPMLWNFSKKKTLPFLKNLISRFEIRKNSISSTSWIRINKSQDF